MEQNTDLYDTLVGGLDDEERAETIRLMQENHAEQLRILRARHDYPEAAPEQRTEQHPQQG